MPESSVYSHTLREVLSEINRNSSVDIELLDHEILSVANDAVGFKLHSRINHPEYILRLCIDTECFRWPKAKLTAKIGERVISFFIDRQGEKCQRIYRE